MNKLFGVFFFSLFLQWRFVPVLKNFRLDLLNTRRFLHTTSRSVEVCLDATPQQKVSMFWPNLLGNQASDPPISMFGKYRDAKILHFLHLNFKCILILVVCRIHILYCQVYILFNFCLNRLVLLFLVIFMCYVLFSMLYGCFLSNDITFFLKKSGCFK